jgi:hypothetical protein
MAKRASATRKKRIVNKRTVKKRVVKKRTSSGGKAEASGGNYEALVATWYAHLVLLGGAAQPPFDLRAGLQVVSFSCQSEAPVDDVNATTSDAGIIFVQAKRSVTMSSVASSSFAKALDQFVRLVQACAAKDPKHTWSRPLDPLRDRLVLATRSASSAKVTEVLSELLRRICDGAEVRTIKDVAVSQAEKEVAKTVETGLKRSWRAAYGRAATVGDLHAILRLFRVQALDLESDQRDQRIIHEQFRVDLLQDPTQAGVAFAELVKLSGRLRAERSGSDRPTLLRLLTDAGIRLRAMPDFRGDVAALTQWTTARLASAPRFTRLLADDPRLTIERAAWPAFRAAVETRSTLLVGEPGAGKSGLTYRLVSSAREAGRDVVFIPVDLLNVDTFAGLQTELGITHALAEVLANWPGSDRGLLILDALDAARKPETQKLLREVVGQVLGHGDTRWNVIASVRKYDLRQGTEWSAMFRGRLPVPDHADPEFSGVSHVSIGRLSNAEVSQIAGSLPALEDLYTRASPKLRDLLQNIFNLHLLADLLSAGVARADLNEITTQSELLDSYWRYRVRGEDGRHDERETALTVIVNRMIDTQELRVLRADIRPHVVADALVGLERQGILHAEDQGGRPNEDVLLFNHHVLFDYAVARLIFLRGRQPDRLVALLSARRELSLMLSPSLTLALTDAWNAGTDRKPFWELAFALGATRGLPGVAQLAAPTVVVEHTKDLADVNPVLEALKATGARRDAAENVALNIVGALFVRMNAGVPLVGPSAGPWMEFADQLTSLGQDRLMLAVRALIANAVNAL